MNDNWTVPTTAVMNNVPSAYPFWSSERAATEHLRVVTMPRQDRESATLYLTVSMFGWGGRMHYAINVSIEAVSYWPVPVRNDGYDASALLGVIAPAHPLEPLFSRPIKLKITELPSLRPHISLDPFLFESNE